MNLSKILKHQATTKTRTSGKRRAIWEAKAAFEARGLQYNNAIRNDPAYFNNMHMLILGAIKFSQATGVWEWENNQGMSMNDILSFTSSVKAGTAKQPEDYEEMITNERKEQDKETKAILSAPDPISYIMNNCKEYDYNIDEESDKGVNINLITERSPSKKEAEAMYLEISK